MRRLQAGSMPVWPRSGHYYYGASRHMISGPGTDCQGPPGLTVAQRGAPCTL